MSECHDAEKKRLNAVLEREKEQSISDLSQQRQELGLEAQRVEGGWKIKHGEITWFLVCRCIDFFQWSLVPCCFGQHSVDYGAQNNNNLIAYLPTYLPAWLTLSLISTHSHSPHQERNCRLCRISTQMCWPRHLVTLQSCLGKREFIEISNFYSILFYFILFNLELWSELQTYVERIVQSIEVLCDCCVCSRPRVFVCVYVRSYVSTYTCVWCYRYLKTIGWTSTIRPEPLNFLIFTVTC